MRFKSVTFFITLLTIGYALITYFGITALSRSYLTWVLLFILALMLCLIFSILLWFLSKGKEYEKFQMKTQFIIISVGLLVFPITILKSNSMEASEDKLYILEKICVIHCIIKMGELCI